MNSAKKKPKTIDQYLANVNLTTARHFKSSGKPFRPQHRRLRNALVTEFPPFGTTDVHWFSLGRGPIIARFIQVVLQR
jgi:hypothetical protein